MGPPNGKGYVAFLISQNDNITPTALGVPKVETKSDLARGDYFLWLQLSCFFFCSRKNKKITFYVIFHPL